MNDNIDTIINNLRRLKTATNDLSEKIESKNRSVKENMMVCKDCGKKLNNIIVNN